MRNLYLNLTGLWSHDWTVYEVIIPCISNLLWYAFYFFFVFPKKPSEEKEKVDILNKHWVNFKFRCFFVSTKAFILCSVFGRNMAWTQQSIGKLEITNASVYLSIFKCV